MDNNNLLAAVLSDRRTHDALVQLGFAGLEFEDAARVVFDCAGEQYQRDELLAAVDRNLLRHQVERRYGVGSMADSVLSFAADLPVIASVANVAEEYRLLRLRRTATELATRLASGDHSDETREALEHYKTLISGAAAEEVKDRLEFDDFTEEAGERIKLYPSSINKVISGGVHRGNNLTVFGRPNSGKSMFALNNAACLIMNGYKVLYVANEEPAFDLTRRLLSRIVKTDIGHLEDRDRLKEAFDRAGEAYKRNWHLMHKAGCTYHDIRRACARVKPDIIIVDQLKNVHIKEDNRALQLDKLARQVRELGIEFAAVTISVTQAGESAEGKLVLGMSDVEWSNTGIPGAADLMIGLGVNDDFDAQDKRMISIPKNKLKNWHGAFPVWIKPELTLISGQAL
jgi:KaiC/GvpD/RAD55 family RecA-like ATPase